MFPAIFFTLVTGFIVYLLFFREHKNTEIPSRTTKKVKNADQPEQEYTFETMEDKSCESGDDDVDNFERFDFYKAEMLSAIGNYHIEYEDQKGKRTERDIQVKRVHEVEGKYAVDAHCLLRNQHRSFIDERIKKVINLDTGEIVKSLAVDAIAQYNNSGEGQVLTAINKDWQGMAILAFVCRADGQMRKPERLIVAEYLKKRCPQVSAYENEIDAAIKNLLDPDHREYARIVRDLKTTGARQHLLDLFEYAKKIVATQKTITPMEKAALEVLAEAVT